MMTAFFFLSFFVEAEIGSFFSFFYFSLLVPSLSCVWLFATPWTATCQACCSPSPTPGACLNSCPLSQWCHPTVVLCHPLCHPLLFLPSVFPSIRVFSNESVLHIKWPSWCFSFSISPSNEYLGLISFRIDWFDLLGVQGTLRSLLQHHSCFFSVLFSPTPQFFSVTNSNSMQTF